SEIARLQTLERQGNLAAFSTGGAQRRAKRAEFRTRSYSPCQRAHAFNNLAKIRADVEFRAARRRSKAPGRRRNTFSQARFPFSESQSILSHSTKSQWLGVPFSRTS